MAIEICIYLGIVIGDLIYVEIGRCERRGLGDRKK